MKKTIIAIVVLGALTAIAIFGPLAEELGIREVRRGTMGFISCPDVVRGTAPFSIMIEVQNRGNVDTTFEVQVSSPYLELIVVPPLRAIALGQLGSFEFTARAKYAGSPEITAPLDLKLYADGVIADSRSLLVTIYMPKLEVTRVEITPQTEWFGRWWVFKLDMEVRNVGQASASDVTAEVAWIVDGVVKDRASESIGYLGAGSVYPLTFVLDYEAYETGKIRVEARSVEGSYWIQETNEFMALGNSCWQAG